MRFTLAMLAVVLSGCAVNNFAERVCEIDGGARSGVPLTLTADFGISGCTSSNATCSASVDGGVIVLTTSSTICPTGTNPGGVTITASCSIPPLEPGSYELVPFNGSLVVVADGGGATSCP